MVGCSRIARAALLAGPTRRPLLDLPGAFGGGIEPFPTGPVTVLDALATGKPVEGWALILAAAGALLGGAIAVEMLSKGRAPTEPSSRTLADARWRQD